jgi:hypothetical protein
MTTPIPPTIPNSENYNDLFVNTLKSETDLGIDAAGINTNVQFNNSGSFGANPNFNFTEGSNTLIAGNSTLGATSVGFFGSSANKQGTGTYDLQRLIDILANYGLVIQNNAYTQQAKFVGTGYIGPNPLQGFAVSLNSDGTTLALGGIEDDNNKGAVWVFTRSGSTWSQQAKIVGSPISGTWRGYALSLSADGNTLAIGGPGFIYSNVGFTLIYTRSAGVWTEEAVLIGTGRIGNSAQGSGVGLSDDGNTLIVGGPEDNGDIGATWVFTRTGTVWTQQGSKLVGTGAIGGAKQGIDVAVSSDGNTFVTGGYNDDGTRGANWIFTRTAGVWTQQGPKLVGTGSSTDQGFNVSLSGDGNTMVTGARETDFGVGAVWVFTRTAGVWTQQARLLGTGVIGISSQGRNVEISKDGNLLVLGGFNDDNALGATWVFTRSGNTWYQRGNKIVATGAIGAAQQSRGLALSGDKQYLAIGGAFDNGAIGATWVFNSVFI